MSKGGGGGVDGGMGTRKSSVANTMMMMSVFVCDLCVCLFVCSLFELDWFRASDGSPAPLPLPFQSVCVCVSHKTGSFNRYLGEFDVCLVRR